MWVLWHMPKEVTVATIENTGAFIFAPGLLWRPDGMAERVECLSPILRDRGIQTLWVSNSDRVK